MRLTTDLINSSLSYVNPLKERELDLRGHRIPAIENLGAVKDHDAIDFTDNDIAILTNFALSPRLTTLLLARNRVSSIATDLKKSIPNITTLQLESNRLTELADLDPLGQFTRLTHLVLIGNPVYAKEHYRYWVLWRCPHVRFLDYEKVKQAERDKATELFGLADSPTTLATQISKIKSSNTQQLNAGLEKQSRASVSTGTERIGRVKLSAKERKRVEQMIRNAKTLSEVARLEKELNEGRIPGGIRQDDD